jgi:hypothetical protein
VVGVACGAEHSLCCTSGGEAFSWGWGRYGNLGDGECCDRWGRRGAGVMAAGARHAAPLLRLGGVLRSRRAAALP